MNDITIVYYTANKIEKQFEANICNHLLSWAPEGTPIISVSQKPMNYGRNICVGDIGYSIYNIYKQILIGAKEVQTQYIMCQEDDALYNIEHFSYRPKGNSFAYNINRWIVDPDKFFHRNRANMCMCIAPTDLMISTLEERFKQYPSLPDNSNLKKENLVGFGEPGRFEIKLGLPSVGIEIFNTEIPTLVFNHRPSVGGVRRLMRKDIIQKELPYWGKAEDLWKKYYA